MPHRLRWTQLRIGLAALLVLLGAAAAILRFGRVGALRGHTFRLYVATDAARGVTRGSEVWLDGQRVGVVRHVAFRSPAAPRNERLVLALDVLDGARSRIRIDSRARVRAGANILGDRVVYVTSGTTRTRPVANGDTLVASSDADLDSLSSRATLAARELPGIVENAKLVAAGLATAEGTLGALGFDDRSDAMRRIRERSRRLIARLSSSRGTIGLARGAADEISVRAARAMAQADSIRALLASDRHSLGRFRRDSTLAREVGRVRTELAAVHRIVSDSGTSIARVSADSAIVRSIHRALASLDSLSADMRKHPLRYIVF